PVAGIDAQLAIALREAPEALRPRLIRARQAASRLGRVIQALLAMFRSGVDPQRQTIRLSELLQPLSFSELQIDIRNDEALSADPDLLTAALLNLLDNAQRHQARQVQLILVHDAGWTRLRLHDDGVGCPPERLQQLRQALARQDYSTDSGLKGLGLILADLVMRAHGGRMELPQVEPGFCVDLNWPST
ncbi:sensor histidine kinase, partial [Rhodoferax sp.]